MCCYDYTKTLLISVLSQVINSRQNRIYSLKVFHFVLYRRSSILQDIYFLYRAQRFVSGLFSSRVSDDWRSDCGRIQKRVRARHQLAPQKMVWRDSVGVKSSGSGIKSECADIFYQSRISGCYAILTSPKEGETAVCGYNPALF